MRELIAAADHEGVESVFGIELSSRVEIKTRLRTSRRAHRSHGAGCRRRVMVCGLSRNRLRRWALCDHRGIFIDSDELKVFKLQVEIIDGFEDKVAVLV